MARHDYATRGVVVEGRLVRPGQRRRRAIGGGIAVRERDRLQTSGTESHRDGLWKMHDSAGCVDASGGRSSGRDWRIERQLQPGVPVAADRERVAVLM